MSVSICFSTLACPDWDWHTLLDRARTYGYDGIEVRLLKHETDLLSLPEFARRNRPHRLAELGDHGLSLCGLASSVRFDVPTRELWQTQFDEGRAYLDLARELEVGFVRVFGDVLAPEACPWDQATVMSHIIEGLQRLGEYGESLGVDVLIETHGDFADTHNMAAALSQVASPAVGVLWDTHHPWRFYSESLGDTWKRIGPWVRHTHWKDSVSKRGGKQRGGKQRADSQAEQAAAKAHALMSGHRHADYEWFGRGEFPAVDCARLLLNAGYTGWYSLEWEKAWHPELADPEEVLPLFPDELRRVLNQAR